VTQKEKKWCDHNCSRKLWAASKRRWHKLKAKRNKQLAPCNEDEKPTEAVTETDTTLATTLTFEELLQLRSDVKFTACRIYETRQAATPKNESIWIKKLVSIATSHKKTNGTRSITTNFLTQVFMSQLSCRYWRTSWKSANRWAMQLVTKLFIKMRFEALPRNHKLRAFLTKSHFCRKESTNSLVENKWAMQLVTDKDDWD